MHGWRSMFDIDNHFQIKVKRRWRGGARLAAYVIAIVMIFLDEKFAVAAREPRAMPRTAAAGPREVLHAGFISGLVPGHFAQASDPGVKHGWWRYIHAQSVGCISKTDLSEDCIFCL
jgi:hypothetical protein